MYLTYKFLCKNFILLLHYLYSPCLKMVLEVGLSVWFLLIMCLYIKIVAWIINIKVKDKKKLCLTRFQDLLPDVCSTKIMIYIKYLWFAKMCNMEKKTWGHQISKKLGHSNKKKRWTFQINWIKYRSNTPVCMFTVHKGHIHDMASLQPNKIWSHEI